MPQTFFRKTSAFTAKKKKTHFSVVAVKEGKYKAWLAKQSAALSSLCNETGFKGKAGQILVSRDECVIYAGVSDSLKLFDFAGVCEKIRGFFSDEALSAMSFEITGLSGAEMDKAHIGWGWACYAFDLYKSKTKPTPALLWAKGVDKESVLSHVESVNALRDLVNTPANDMGPEEIEAAVKALAKEHEATLKVIKDQKALEKDFPLIFTVGKASPRKPRLIDMSWGNAKHPKVTLVGKGVAFDTGGLDLKPSTYMALMKKDMGGAAHVIALAKLIMDHKLPVRLRLLIPAVENSVAGEAFRPGDIIKSRKGPFVENTNTDAEGRLILADALTYASEGKPDLIIDFATLTGSARAGLGPDIPAMFSNNDKIAGRLQALSEETEDPVWRMPLWQPYRAHIENATGDLLNSVGIPGDGIYSALFLETFVDEKTDWVHLDCFSWEQTGRAGRPKGAADTGLRTVFAYLQDRYG
ncbi:MAG: leucyl aminopeptidase family protein [Alphaproteobacteria bacterium]